MYYISFYDTRLRLEQIFISSIKPRMVFSRITIGIEKVGMLGTRYTCGNRIIIINYGLTYRILFIPAKSY